MNLQIPYTLIGVSRGAVQRVGEFIFNAGEAGVTIPEIVENTGLSKSTVESALTALRRKCKAPIYTFVSGHISKYVWGELKIANLEDDNG